MKIALAGGGTGGHISPAIAVAEAIFRMMPQAVVDFIATPRPVDRRMYRRFGDAVHTLDPPRIDRGLLDMLLLPPRAVREFYRARRLLRSLGSSVLLSTGGYSSFFPVAAARSLGIPSLIHESNSIPGKANRLASLFADRVLIGFESAADGFRKTSIVTGNPVRSSLKIMDRLQARDRLGIHSDCMTVLFLGGSQGARVVNDLALAVPEGYHVILQCGSRDLERVNEESRGNRRITVVDFLDDPSLLYSASDLAVARSGAMTTAELSWLRIPAIYIPYPYAADDHQKWNAEEIVSKGGAVVVDQSGLKTDELWELVIRLISSPSELSNMRASLERLMPENPADRIADDVIALAEKGLS